MKFNNLLFGLGVSLASLSVSFAARTDEDGYHKRYDGDLHGLRIFYAPDSLRQSTIKKGPWTLHETARYGKLGHDASGVVPPKTFKPPYTGYGTPYAALCKNGVFSDNYGRSVMQPYYFPFVRRHGEKLEGFFDYRPRNQQEATVVATSEDWGSTWEFKGEVLALNPYCPADPTDPDNLNVLVNGVSTAYGSDPSNAADNGLGHPVGLTVNGVQRIYQLNRATGFIDSAQLVVHTLPSLTKEGLGTLPDYGYVSPLASGGYPKLESTATLTKGLINPDAIMGAMTSGATTTVVYVSKALGADTKLGYPACPSTPAFALTNLVNGSPRKANHDVTSVRVATTTDGVNFTDVGAASGLNDPATVVLNGTRYLGSGSILPLSDGRYGMLFGAGNCLDNDSDGFHYIGYAETANRVNGPNDLLNWKVLYGLDNPILSTDTVTDPAGPRPYPLKPPVVNVTGATALTSDQVAPFTPAVALPPLITPPGGYNSNFFSGRVYDPQPQYTDAETVTIVFAGYNTPQPSNNLGDYRSIGRFQVKFPRYYVAPF